MRNTNLTGRMHLITDIRFVQTEALGTRRFPGEIILERLLNSPIPEINITGNSWEYYGRTELGLEDTPIE